MMVCLIDSVKHRALLGFQEGATPFYTVLMKCVRSLISIRSLSHFPISILLPLFSAELLFVNVV